MVIYIQAITDEWVDCLILYEDFTIKRSSCDDSGYFNVEDKYLKINWEKWGTEVFQNVNNIYYNCKDFFEIELENNDWNNICVFEKNTNIVKKKNCKDENEYGFFQFENNDLIINWNKWGKERFYKFNHGKNYKNIKDKYCMRNNKPVKIIAIVFPQFHEIPENNEFWGDGFTEWTLLKNIPRIVNGQIIKQPHEDIGYFNLKSYEHRKYMRVLADKYNIFGFCYYHYWFKNKKVMYEPTELMLEDDEPNKPFFFCWANEQWTKRWDGGNNEILIKQEYSDLDGNIEHFKYLLTFFKNKNYIKKMNKPIFIFYRIEEKDIEDIKEIIKLWNELALEEGFDGIHFMRFLGPFNNEIILDEINGFVEFAPGYFTQKYFKDITSEDDNKIFDEFDGEFDEETYLRKNNDIKEHINENLILSGYDHYKSLGDNEKKIRTSKFFVYDGIKLYDKIVENKKTFSEQHRGISVNWNNTPRRNYTSKEYSKYPHYYKDITPSRFSNTIYSLLDKIYNEQNKDDDFLFISAWNEWNEQAILEPNNEDGYDYLINLGKKYFEFYNYPKRGNILMISHQGGGTEKYSNDLKELYYDYNFIDFGNFDINIDYDMFYSNLDLIHINSILFNNLKNNYIHLFTNFFKDTKKYLTIHDYQWLFPDDPNILQDNFFSNLPSFNNIESFTFLLNLCSKIIFPSNNIYYNYNIHINLDKYKDKIYIVNHCDKIINYNLLYIPPIKKNIINVAYIGYFTNYKGSNFFKKISNENKIYKEYTIVYHVFGNIAHSEKDIFNKNIIFHYNYIDSEIIDILHKNNIHGITHLSLFEESYCYALTNSINSGLPILYLNRGAFTDRLKNNDKFFSCEYNNLNKIFNNFFKYIIDNQNSNNFYKLNNNIQPNKWYLENYP